MPPQGAHRRFPAAAGSFFAGGGSPCSLGLDLDRFSFSRQMADD